MNNLHLATHSPAGKMQSTIICHWINCSASMSNAWLCQTSLQGPVLCYCWLVTIFWCSFYRYCSTVLLEARRLQRHLKTREQLLSGMNSSWFSSAKLAIFYTTEHAQSFGELCKEEETGESIILLGASQMELENSLDREVLGKHEKPLYPTNYCTKKLFPGVWFIW